MSSKSEISPYPIDPSAGAEFAERHGLTVRTNAAPIPDAPQTIPELVAERTSLGDLEAIVGTDGTITYGELEHRVAKAAQALVDAGVRPFDRVAASLPNSTEIVVAFLAAQRIGAIWVGVNLALTAAEKSYILRDADVSLLIATDAVAGDLRSASAELPSELSIITGSGEHGDSEWAHIVEAAGELADDWPMPDPFAPAAIAYTSGTTGFPKGAAHSQHNMLVPPAVQREIGFLERGSRSAQPLPFTILNIMIVGALTTLMNEATLIAATRNDYRGVIEWCQRVHADSILLAGPTVYDLVASPDVEADDIASVTRVTCGGAGVTEELRSGFEEKFGRRFSVGYGMTEAPTSVVYEPYDRPRVAGASGIAAPQVVITVRDETGQVVPNGTEGEFCVEGTSEGRWASVYVPMLGYWQQPEKTSEVLGEGFYRSGDVGFIDDAGYCHIMARRSEMILRGGSNIYPAEIERVIMLHPGVAACAVLGIPHDRLGEEVVAAVEPAPGVTLDTDEVLATCRRHLTRTKVPAQVAIVPSLPRNQMGKVVRASIKSAFFGG